MENMNELFAALAKAQMEMTNAEKNNDNAFLKSKYADLSSVMEAARPHLAKHGLAVIQRMVMMEGELYLQTILGHSSGQSIESTIRIDVKESNEPGKKSNYYHALGSGITYLRRYAYTALVGVAVGSNEDDDGNGAVPQGYKPTPKEVKPEKAPTKLIDADQLQNLLINITAKPELLEDILQKAGIKELKQMPYKWYKPCMDYIEEQTKEVEF